MSDRKQDDTEQPVRRASGGEPEAGARAENTEGRDVARTERGARDRRDREEMGRPDADARAQAHARDVTERRDREAREAAEVAENADLPDTRPENRDEEES